MFVSPLPMLAHTSATEVAHTLIVTRHVIDDANWRRARVNPLSGGGEKGNLPPSSTNEQEHLWQLLESPKNWGSVFAQGIRVAFSDTIKRSTLMEEIANWHVRRVQHDLFGFKTHVFLPNTELGYQAGPRLRELVSAVRGSQEAGLTQPRTHLIA